MSPFVSNVTSSLFSGDLATVFGSVRQLRADVLVADIAASHEEHDGAEASEISTRFIAALQSGDSRAEFELWDLARDYDQAQPFGPRLVDELDALAARFTPIAA